MVKMTKSGLFTMAIALSLFSGCTLFKTTGTEKAPEGAAVEQAAPAGENKVIKLIAYDKDAFEKDIAKDSKQMVVIDFFATWCPHCQPMLPLNEAMAKKYAQVKFYAIDIDQFKDIATRFAVKGVPNFVFFKDGNQVEQHVGTMDEALYSKTIEEKFGLAPAAK